MKNKKKVAGTLLKVDPKTVNEQAKKLLEKLKAQATQAEGEGQPG